MSKRRFLLLMVITLLTTSACDKGNPLIEKEKDKENGVFEWSNPIKYSLQGNKGLRDPFILKEGDYWYLTGTNYPYCLAKENPNNDKTLGVPLFKSTDLEEWEFVGIMVESPSNDERNKWYQDRFWAPELFHHNGKFYITVNCCAPDGSNHGMLFAVADNIEGPYTIMNEDKPLFVGNDAHLFVDDDGKTYLYGSDIWGVEIDLISLKTMGTKTNQIAPVNGSTAWNGRRDHVGLEGPYVMKRNSIYYLFYSTWSRGYEVGYAISDNPLKNWNIEKDP